MEYRSSVVRCEEHSLDRIWENKSERARGSSIKLLPFNLEEANNREKASRR